MRDGGYERDRGEEFWFRKEEIVSSEDVPKVLPSCYGSQRLVLGRFGRRTFTLYNLVFTFGGKAEEKFE